MQVSFEIPENTHETDNLLYIKDNYKKILITGKYYEQKEIDGILLDKGKIIATGKTQLVLNSANLAKAFDISVKFDVERREIYGIEKLET